jgi:hypothetical protein
MEKLFPVNGKELRRQNAVKYKATPPSWEVIQSAIEKSGLKRMVIFEDVWGIPRGTLTLYKCGERVLPVRYWHIFYDFDTINQIYTKSQKKSKPLQNKTTILTTNKTLLDDISRF